MIFQDVSCVLFKRVRVCVAVCCSMYIVLFPMITGTAFSNFTVKSGDMKILSSYNSYGADFVDAQNCWFSEAVSTYYRIVHII